MRLLSSNSLRGCAFFLGVTLLALSGVRAEVITLKSGLQLEGRLTKVSSLNEDPFAAKSAGKVDVRKIVLVDDNLRRTFVSSNLVLPGGVAADADISLEKIVIDKRIAQVGRRLGGIGPILEVTPFDEFGNRIFSMQSESGRLDVIQGITEITPVYTKVEGLLRSRNAFIWDMRLSTASIPREILTKVLMGQIEPSDAQQRLRVVTLYIQAKRYRDALLELDRVIQDFPDMKDLQTQRQRLYQLVTTDVIREIESRRDAGQHRQAYALLTGFPEKDVAGELLLKVRDMVDDYDRLRTQGEQSLKLLEQHAGELSGHREKEKIVAISNEIRAQMNFNTLDRMADYLRLADDAKLKTDQKLALAVSGWLLGSGSGTENLAEALSLVDVRDVVREYLRSNTQIERDDLLQRLRELEGSSPANLAKIIAHMAPPVITQVPTEGVPGLLEMTVPGIDDSSQIRYAVQVPPEYDPLRRYPCIVTMHGAGSTALDQIDWWAGHYDAEKRLRVGQATRLGYIVIAPLWADDSQRQFNYSLREHAAVLLSLRDACQRFSIDTDRVFLSGHSMGGDAAWDIGLAHPDLWAGIIPVVATSDKYVTRYWPNAKGLPFYFVAGQMDNNKIARNARDIDRYLTRAGFDAIYVEYQGRGHEHFHDEIIRIFDWMDRYRRDFQNKDFECVSMRPWDQFFWWLEVDGFPDRSMVLPINWPEPKSITARTEARISENNGVYIKTAATDVVLYLNPDLVSFDRRISINGKRVEVAPDVEVLLEDVRTRGDRQHPFWARVIPSVGRRR
jgi:predicted esterase